MLIFGYVASFRRSKLAKAISFVASPIAKYVDTQMTMISTFRSSTLSTTPQYAAITFSSFEATIVIVSTPSRPITTSPTFSLQYTLDEIVEIHEKCLCFNCKSLDH